MAGQARSLATAGGASLDTSPQPPIDKAEIRRLVLKIAWPSILENLLQSVLGMITIFMVARLGSSEVAAVGASQQIQILFISAFFSLSMGATVIVAHAYGAGRTDGINVAAKQSAVAGLVMSVVIAAIVFAFAHPMIEMFGAKPDVVEQGARFQQISAIGYVFMAMMFTLGGALRGVGDTRTPMLVTAGINVINVAVAWPLIFGVGGAPRMELDGAAIAQNISRFVGCGVMVVLLLRGHRGVSIAGRDGWRIDLPFMKRLADISIPAMAESLLRSGGQILFLIIVFRLGTDIVASHNIAQQAVFLSMFPGFGFSMAATALVGQSLGAGNPARAFAATMTSTRGCIIWMSLMGLAFFFGAEPIMRLSTDNPDIIDPGVAALRVIAFAQPFQAIGFVLAGALRGAGDTRFPMISTGLSMWVFRIPLAWVLAITLDLGLAGVYLAMGIDNLILMGMNIWRWRQGKWKTSRLATHATADTPGNSAATTTDRASSTSTEAEAVVADG